MDGSSSCKYCSQLSFTVTLLNSQIMQVLHEICDKNRRFVCKKKECQVDIAKQISFIMPNVCVSVHGLLDDRGTY